MKSFLVSIDIDILAQDREHAAQRAWLLCHDLEERHWVQATRPGGLYEHEVNQPGKETP